MINVFRNQLGLCLQLFGLGFAGVLSALPLIPKLIATQEETPPIPMPLLQLLSTLQSAAILAGLVALGTVFAQKVDLHAPALAALARRKDPRPALSRALLPGIGWGLAGGAFLTLLTTIALKHLPSDFVAAAASFEPPWYTRLLYGGITEEIMIRWGLMPLLVWLSFKAFQRSGSIVRPRHYLIGATLSALLFGAGHLPIASLLTTELTPLVVAYVVLGNAAFGLIAGALFWRRGLESAILAHMTAHLVMLAAAGLAA